MKTYFIRHGDFANIYNLAWADNKADISWLVSQNFERCTRREAENYARRERDRRKYNHTFSGYADDVIYPAKFYKLSHDEALDFLWKHCEVKGVIVE